MKRQERGQRANRRAGILDLRLMFCAIGPSISLEEVELVY